MELLQFPAELLLQIFEYIGSAYFCSGLSRITVCKQWSEFVLIALIHQVSLAPRKLQRWLSSSYIETTRPQVKANVRILELSLHGFKDWQVFLPHSSEDSHGRALRAAWTAQLDKNLRALATIIEQSRKLRILRVQATSSQLSTLIYPALNLFRVKVKRSVVKSFTPARLRSIAALLPTLRVLRLRLRNICTDVLKPPHQTQKLALREMLINLSLLEESPFATSATHATSCDSSRGGFLQLKVDMEKEAQALVERMAAPKIVRLLTHTPLPLQMEAFDVLTGKNINLGEGAEWDADGDTVEDDALYEASEISSLSSDDDG